MSQSLVQIYLHIIFSTKDRRPFLQDRAIQREMHAYLAGACNNMKCPALIIGGVADHVHILCRLAKTIDVSHLLQELKRESSKWIKSKGIAYASFYWQNGYGAFSVSPSHVDALRKYIANQEEHHKTEVFQDELRRICAKYGVVLDERYAWD